jgi:hypothetical protein
VLGLSSPSLKKYHWPLLAGSAPLFLVSFVIALLWKNPTLPFTLTALAALVYTTLHVARPRWYVWSAALLCALSAYLLFFWLPAMQGIDVPLEYQFLVASLLLLIPGLFTKSPLSWQSHTQLPALVLGVIVSLLAMTALVDLDHTGRGALVLAVYAVLFTLYALHTKYQWLGYFATAAGSLAVVYALDHFNLDLWLPILTSFSILLYGAGLLLRRSSDERKAWGNVLVISGLTLGALLSLASLGLFKETSGWYILLIAALFTVEMFTRPFPWLELTVEALLTLALYRILVDFQVTQVAYFLFSVSLIWLGGDLLFGYFIREKRPARPFTLAVGYTLAAISTFALWDEQNTLATVAFYSIYTLFFACYAILQHESRLGYLATAFLSLSVFKLSDALGFEENVFPLILISVLYYASGFWLRHKRTGSGWDRMLLYSGLCLAVVTSLLAPTEEGWETSIAVAIAATLFAVEALARHNVWLAVPANALYLLSYFMILRDLDVDEPQFYSIGAALLGMLMHYLLTRAGSRKGAFIAGMLSQLVLLGTTYIQMVSTEKLSFFFLLFIQCMVVLVYGLIQRSRSLLTAPILFAVVGVMTVIYTALKGLGPVILIGTTGLALLMAGIAAVLMRERISRLGEQLSDWKP